jgi:hypothetical protein
LPVGFVLPYTDYDQVGRFPVKRSLRVDVDDPIPRIGECKNKTYQPYIVSFMSFTHNTTYPSAAEFTKERLLAIKPHHVK